jgi:DNA-binding XRE family transcriptional regulator
MIRNLSSVTEDRTERGRNVSPLLVYRTAARLTQRELAELAGVAPETISNAERRRHRPQRLTARALATALGCEVEELFP